MVKTTMTRMKEKEITANEEHTIFDQLEAPGEQSSRPELVARRQSSFSDAFSKITTNPFNRRRTTTLIQNPTSAVALSYPSRIPTPSGIPKSTSFFSTLNAFASKPSSIVGDSEDLEPRTISKPPRRISDRLAQTPFFSHQHRVNTPPFLNKQKRGLTVQIEQRGLMAPLHPPLPRSSTMGNLGQEQSTQNSPHTPGFMRSTSSSAARRSSLNTPKQRNTPMPSIPSSKTPPSADRKSRPGSGVSRKATSSCHPMPSIELTLRSVSPINGRRQTSFHRLPSSSDPTTKDRAITSHRNFMMAEAQGRTPPLSGSSGRTSCLPSPKERRMEWSQGKRNGKPLPSALRPSEHGDDGTDERTPFSMDDPSANERLFRESVKASDYHAGGINTALLAKDHGNTYPNVPACLSNNDAEDTLVVARLTTSTSDKVAVAFEPEGPAFPLRNLSNPRLASQFPIPPCSSPTNLSSPLIHLNLTACQIHTALHPLEWLGRYTALSDRFRTSALPSSPSRSEDSSSSNTLTNSFHEPMHDETQRNRRIWIHLQSLCTTDEARESLALFKAHMEEREKKMAGGVKGAKVKEKQGFFQSLIGKRR